MVLAKQGLVHSTSAEIFSYYVLFDVSIFIKIPAVTDQPGEVYKLICDYNYPFRVDNRSIEEKIRQEVEYYIHRYSRDEVHCLEDGNIEIPLVILLPHVETWCDSIEGLRKILEAATWTISDKNPEIPAVVYPYYDRYSSSGDEEDGELEVSFPSQEQLVEGDYLQSTEDWDECAVSPDIPSEASSSLSPRKLNGWDVIDRQSETVLPLSLIAKQEVLNFKENGSPPFLTDIGLGLIPIAPSFSHEVEKVTETKPAVSPSTSNNALQLNGECFDVSSMGHIEVENLFNGINSASGENMPVGMLFQSNIVGSISESDSAIVMAGSCVKSLDDVTLSMAAQTTDFLSNSLQGPGSINGVDCHEVPRENLELCGASSIEQLGYSASMENNASNSMEFPQQVIDASDSSRSFFMHLLSQERETRHDVSRSASNEDEVGFSVSDLRMDLDLSPDLEDVEYESIDSDDSLSGHSQDGGFQLMDNRAVPRRVQPHRNHFPFGLNDVVVENGDVANNNRDGEGNNAVPLEDMDDDLDDMFDVEVGDHEEDDEDFDNANDLILPDHADPFPPWLLHLLQAANDEGVELGAAGEPHIFLGDL